MLGLESRLRRRDEEVLAKVMDGEVVIINLANGTYYSADRVGSMVWTRIDEGLRLGDVAAEVAALYDVSTENARQDVLAFAGELLREDLVAVEENGVAPAAKIASPAAKLAYTRPQIHVYRDMEDLLALDPPTPGLADLRWKQ
jgi:hypothetical protein